MTEGGGTLCARQQPLRLSGFAIERVEGRAQCSVLQKPPDSLVEFAVAPRETLKFGTHVDRDNSPEILAYPPGCFLKLVGDEFVHSWLELSRDEDFEKRSWRLVKSAGAASSRSSRASMRKNFWMSRRRLFSPK
jgi:hypothetical protein